MRGRYFADLLIRTSQKVSQHISFCTLGCIVATLAAMQGQATANDWRTSTAERVAIDSAGPTSWKITSVIRRIHGGIGALALLPARRHIRCQCEHSR